MQKIKLSDGREVVMILDESPVHEDFNNYDFLDDTEIKKEKWFRIGDYKFNKEDLNISKSSLVSKIKKDNILHYNISHSNSSSKILSLFDKLFLETFLTESECMRLSSVSQYTNIPATFENIKIIKQAIEDNLSINPLIFHTMKTTKELKKVLGQGLWSRLCQENEKFNKRIVNFLVYENNKISKDINNLILNLTKSQISFSFDEKMPNGVKYCYLNNLTQRKAFEEIVDVTTIQDCHRYCEINLEEFNRHWSYKRVLKEHEKYRRLTTYETMGVSPDDVFDIPEYLSDENLAKIPNPSGIEYKVLKTAKDYYEEGEAMHHCIATHYAKEAKYGRYFSISLKQGEDRSTAGFRLASIFDIVERSAPYLEQIKSFQNQNKSTPEMRKFCKEIEKLYPAKEEKINYSEPSREKVVYSYSSGFDWLFPILMFGILFVLFQITLSLS